MLTEAEATPEAIRYRVRAFLAEHDPAEMANQDFNDARFDAGLAWVHYPEGLGGLGVSRALQNVVDIEFAAPGSLNSWHQISSPVQSGRSQRFCCSSLP